MLDLIYILLLSTVLYCLSYNTFLIIYLVLTTLFFLAIPLAFEYSRKHKYYQELFSILNNLHQKYLIQEMIPVPRFLEAQLLSELIRRTGKAMADEVNRYKSAQREYREYVEMWVHEIKTPIAASKLIIENHKTDAALKINIELGKIENLVEQTLYYAISNEVGKDYLITRIKLEKIIKKTIRKNADILISNKIYPKLFHLNVSVFGDERWLAYILGQLIVNAAKYASKENKQIEFSAEKLVNKVILTVKDNGIGVPEKDLKHIFEKGFTGENGRLHEKSTGIGLYTCKKLCDKLGLSILVSSEPGQWTRFDIVFPKSNMFFQ